MNKLSRLISIVAVFAVLFTACDSSQKDNKDKESDERRLPNSVGASSEILVVMNEGLWKGDPGKTVREFFHQDVPALPQVEPRFSTANINLTALTRKMFKKHRNLFIVDIDEKYDAASISNKKDVWAVPQRYIRVNAPDLSTFLEAFNKNKDGFMQLFHNSEIRRVQRVFESGEDVTMQNKLMRNRGISLTIPRGFFIAKDLNQFMWIRKETREFSQALLIHFENYRETTQFDRGEIIRRRNQMTRDHVPGPTEGSYMRISDDVSPQMERTTFNGDFAVLTRGLWEVENGFMGGPFMSYTFVDEKNSRLITLDSYVYAPGQEKRDKLLQLEAIMKTFKVVEEK
ncbi:MAG TPA: DUF4837 family protein [Bacteroidales bacterium]|nr:DUF4837 family protein [Bacteroidales bacterium]